MKERIYVRVDKEQKDRFMGKCQRKGLDNSKLIRNWIEEFIQKEESKVQFYRTADEAYQDAESREETGLTGSGQNCGPEYIEGYGWTYKTSDNRFIIPEGELTEKELKKNI